MYREQRRRVRKHRRQREIRRVEKPHAPSENLDWQRKLKPVPQPRKPQRRDPCGAPGEIRSGGWRKLSGRGARDKQSIGSRTVFRSERPDQLAHIAPDPRALLIRRGVVNADRRHGSPVQALADSTSRTRSTSTSGAIGLVRYSTAPASRPVRWLIASTRAVSRITGIVAVVGFVCSARNTSNPLRSAIIMSNRIRSTPLPDR